VGLSPYKQPTKPQTCEVLHSKGPHVKIQGDVIYKQGLNARVLHEMCPTLLQVFKDYKAPLKLCAPLGLLPHNLAPSAKPSQGTRLVKHGRCYHCHLGKKFPLFSEGIVSNTRGASPVASKDP
jgi:hypothetical protein